MEPYPAAETGRRGGYSLSLPQKRRAGEKSAQSGRTRSAMAAASRRVTFPKDESKGAWKPLEDGLAADRARGPFRSSCTHRRVLNPSRWGRGHFHQDPLVVPPPGACGEAPLKHSILNQQGEQASGRKGGGRGSSVSNFIQKGTEGGGIKSSNRWEKEGSHRDWAR